MKKIKYITLEQFNNQNDNPDGHYIVWVRKFFEHEGRTLCGFNCGTVTYINDTITDCPKWLDETEISNNEIKIALIEIIPDI